MCNVHLRSTLGFSVSEHVLRVGLMNSDQGYAHAHRFKKKKPLANKHNTKEFAPNRELFRNMSDVRAENAVK